MISETSVPTKTPPQPVQPTAEKESRTARKPREWTFQPEHINVGPNERVVSVLSGAILAAFGLARRSWAGLAIAGVGGALAYRGVTGHCDAYEALGIDTAKDSAIHVERCYLIARSPEDLYAFWRNFYNLPRIMPHLERIDVRDETHAHWAGRVGPFSNALLEWDTEIIADEPNRKIAWRSLPGGDVITKGEVEFTPSTNNRGTEVRIKLDYVPAAGKLGQWAAAVLGRSPERMLRDELQNFKRLMETGEIPTILGQPHGTCTGRGARSTGKGLTGTRQ